MAKYILIAEAIECNQFFDMKQLSAVKYPNIQTASEAIEEAMGDSDWELFTPEELCDRWNDSDCLDMIVDPAATFAVVIETQESEA